MQGQARAAFLATGGLWRASPADRDLRRAQNNAVLEIQRRIDAMSEPELTTLVNGMHEVCPSFRSIDLRIQDPAINVRSVAQI